eukprot:gene1348-32710_t
MADQVKLALAHLKAIEASPEAIAPYRHGYLYIQSGGMLSFGKGVSRKWFLLEAQGFQTADKPQVGYGL